MKVLITGAAGFIGSHTAQHLLKRGDTVVGLDNFNDFYDPQRKRANLSGLDAPVHEIDIRDRPAIARVFAQEKPDAIVHFAAMAGVRPSIEQPLLYTDVNVGGTANLLDAATKHDVGRVIFISSSSVYGNNDIVPFSEEHRVENPISPYAATKRAGELLCHTAWHLQKLPVSCLRLFTVFGPRQRPDLAISKFLGRLARGERLPIFGDGSTSRDYTYVDDIVAGVLASLDRCDRFRIYNLGGDDPVRLDELVRALESVTGRTADIDREPMQPGDVNRTWADVTRAHDELGYQPKTSLHEGITRQWEWMQAQGLV